MKINLLILLAFTSYSPLSNSYTKSNKMVAQECALLSGSARPLFKVTEVEPKIIHLAFSTYREMTQTFLRFQEYYESPEFHGKKFSRNKFKKWYRTTRNGKFSYYEDWGGFNIPSRILDPFYAGEFKHLTASEKTLLTEFKERAGDFYIIASVKGETTAFNHEISHGRFYVNKAYRSEVLEALSKFDTSSIQKWLLRTGYDEITLMDEVHAYLLNDSDSSKDLDPKNFLQLIDVLKK